MHGRLPTPSLVSLTLALNASLLCRETMSLRWTGSIRLSRSSGSVCTQNALAEQTHAGSTSAAQVMLKSSASQPGGDVRTVVQIYAQRISSQPADCVPLCSPYRRSSVEGWTASTTMTTTPPEVGSGPNSRTTVRSRKGGDHNSRKSSPECRNTNAGDLLRDDSLSPSASEKDGAPAD